ncbi:helix-turn-helix domain-containing protein [Clostridium botulinum]|nr:helix-turn-helix domain-containing protein [Clostridium botulinum]
MINNNYFKIPNDIFSLNLKPNQFVVLAYLLRHTNNNSKAFPSYQTIADNCNITRVTVINVVKQLIEQELIIKEIRKIPTKFQMKLMYIALQTKFLEIVKKKAYQRIVMEQFN